MKMKTWSRHENEREFHNLARIFSTFLPFSGQITIEIKKNGNFLRAVISA